MERRNEIMPNELVRRPSAGVVLGRAGREIRRLDREAMVAAHAQDVKALLFFRQLRLAEDGHMLWVQSITRQVGVAKAATEDCPEALPAIAEALGEFMAVTRVAYRQAFASPG
jgi:hypothetical protein